MSAILSHPYRPKLWTTGFGIVLFSALTLGGRWLAAHADRGMILNGVHLDRDDTVTLFWGITALMAGVLLLVVYSFGLGLFSRCRVTLTDTALSAPRFGLSPSETVVPLLDIRELTLRQQQARRHLVVQHARGKMTILEQMLPGRAAFDELCDALARRLPATPQ